MPRVTQAYRNEDFDPKILAEMVSFHFPVVFGIPQQECLR